MCLLLNKFWSILCLLIWYFPHLSQNLTPFQGLFSPLWLLIDGVLFLCVFREFSSKEFYLHLGQSQIADSCPLPVFVNKTMLEDSHMPLLARGLFGFAPPQWSWVDVTVTGCPQILNYLLWPFTWNSLLTSGHGHYQPGTTLNYIIGVRFTEACK